MKVTMDSRSLEKKITNIVKYSVGFLEGAQSGKKIFLDNMGGRVIETLNRYIDAMARSDRDALHHVYEWYQTGSPAARLFDLTYTVSNLGLSIKSSFRQSATVSKDSSTPFYDKARIMELGIPVTIKPKKASALVFEDAGETVFTKNPITVHDPGGVEAQYGYGFVFNSFFENYFTQAFLKSSGLSDYISNPVSYKQNFAAGATGGKSLGKKVGYTWIINADIGVE
jgi:hypothetical protein